MSRNNLQLLFLGLATVGFVVGCGGIVNYFSGGGITETLVLLVLGWLGPLGGGLPLLVSDLRSDKRNKVGLFKEEE